MKNLPLVSSNPADVVELPLDPKRALAFGGKLELLQSVVAFCRHVYYGAFGPEEGERRYRELTLVDAVALWEAGLPDSRDIN